jgi:hypothetical protein
VVPIFCVSLRCRLYNHSTIHARLFKLKEIEKKGCLFDQKVPVVGFTLFEYDTCNVCHGSARGVSETLQLEEVPRIDQGLSSDSIGCFADPYFLVTSGIYTLVTRATLGAGAGKQCAGVWGNSHTNLQAGRVLFEASYQVGARFLHRTPYRKRCYHCPCHLFCIASHNGDYHRDFDCVFCTSVKSAGIQFLTGEVLQIFVFIEIGL